MAEEILNLSRAIGRFEQTHARSLSKLTLKDYMASLDLLEKALGRDADPSTITVRDGEAAIASRRFHHLSNATIGKILSAWRKFSAWGRKHYGWFDWARDLERPKRPKPELRRLTRSEVAGMLACTTVTEWDRTVVWLLAYTATRRSEARLIKWGDVDLVEATVRIELGKGSKGRMLPIPRVLVTYLARVKESRPAEESTDEAFVAPSVKLWKPPGGPDIREVHPTTPASSQALWRAVKRTAKAAGVRAPHEVTPHMFRRHYLEDRSEAGHNLIALASTAGHSDVRTTQGYIGKASMNAMRVVAENMDFEKGEG